MLLDHCVSSTEEVGSTLNQGMDPELALAGWQGTGTATQTSTEMHVKASYVELPE